MVEFDQLQPDALFVAPAIPYYASVESHVSVEYARKVGREEDRQVTDRRRSALDRISRNTRRAI